MFSQLREHLNWSYMRPKTLSSDSPKSVGLKSHQLTQITISPLSQNFPGGADPKRKSLQAGATSQSASSIHFQVVAGQLLLHAGGLSSPRFLYGEIKLAKKVRGDARRMGVKGGAWGSHIGRPASHPHTQRENVILESLLSAPWQFHNYHAGAKFPS